MLTSLKSHFWHVNVYFTDQSKMQREEAAELNVESLQMQNILFSSFRKFHGLLESELPLARYQPVKIQVIYFADSAGVFLYFYLQYSMNGNSKAH